MLRLRQAVLAARDLEATVARLRDALPLGEPFHDPAVAHFGLRNAVMALGDTFVEVVSPAQEGTAAGRHLERRGGDAGYMLMFQVGDIAAARERIAASAIRVVFEIDLPDISDVHLHPADMGIAIVALDEARPAESWRWGGPSWEGRGPAERTAGAITGATLGARDPQAAAERWAAVLGTPAGADATIPLDGGALRFVEADRDGIEAVHLAPRAGGGAGEAQGDERVDGHVEIAGVRFAVQ